jgi:protein TonB
MFEDATFDARGAMRNHAPQWMMLTAAANATLVAGLVIAPLLYSRVLPNVLVSPRTLYAPQPVKLPEQAVQRGQQAWDRPAIALMPIHNDVPQIAGRPMSGPAPDGGGLSLDPTGTGTGTPGGMGVFGGGQAQRVVAGTPATARISGGVVEGLLLPHATPGYPQIARAAHVEGDVVLGATISTEGRIERLRVISGHPLLREAALGAVKDWRYRPYLLNGTAVEVETTITVRFSLEPR